MDVGGVARLPGSGPVQVAHRTDISVSAGTTRVDLPVEKTVQSPAAGQPLQLDLAARRNGRRHEETREAAARATQSEDREEASAREALREVIERRLDIDPRTRSIVIRETNRDTGETVTQIPDETILKLRAFSRDLMERARESETETRRHLVERTA